MNQESEVLGVLNGRFQIPHNSHIEIAVQAANQVDHLMILIGSANQRVSLKNPFTYTQRKDMLTRALWDAGVMNFSVEPTNDYRYSDTQWCTAVKQTVESRKYPRKETILFGHHKDSSSFYLDLFREWKYIELTSADPALSSTDLREEWFANIQCVTPGMIEKAPAAVINYISKLDLDTNLQAEFEYYKNEAIRFANYPYPETLNFNCADAVIECADHILLIKRKFAPGKDSWALPGGFKNGNETFFQCALREAYEETNLRVPEKAFVKSLVGEKLFDHPNRSYGINRNTVAFHFKISLNPDGSFPRANGSDDALKAEWVPTDEAINKLMMYDDHKDIVSYFTRTMQIPAYLMM